jgi:undecaprenyl-diphosphatase
MSTAMLLGLTRSSAARFSFLLSSPIILGAAAKASLEIWGQGGIPPDEQTAFIVGVLCSAVFGYAVIAFFLRFLQRSTLLVFIYYRIIFGIIVLALAVLSRLPAGA